MNIQCIYASKCWRAAYSCYLVERGYLEPPPRLTLFGEGYANIDMMPKKGIFCENMPLLRSNEPINLCPSLASGDCANCQEFLKESRRLEALDRGRKNRERYNNARPRVNLPQDLRRAIARRDRYTCVYCGRHQNQIVAGKALRCVVDHFVPLAMGGHECDPNNLVLACQECNQAKGASFWERGCRQCHG